MTDTSARGVWAQSPCRGRSIPQCTDSRSEALASEETARCHTTSCASSGPRIQDFWRPVVFSATLQKQQTIESYFLRARGRQAQWLYSASAVPLVSLDGAWPSPWPRLPPASFLLATQPAVSIPDPRSRGLRPGCKRPSGPASQSSINGFVQSRGDSMVGSCQPPAQPQQRPAVSWWVLLFVFLWAGLPSSLMKAWTNWSCV